MNLAIPRDPSLETLEVIAERAAIERRLERETEFFKSALRIVPRELLPSCELRGVERIDSEYYGCVRIRLCGADFDLDGALRPKIHHSGLALAPALDSLEDYSFERARRLELGLRRRLLLSWLPVPILTGLMAVTAVIMATTPVSTGFFIAAFLGSACSGFIITVTLANWPTRAWQLFSPRRYAKPDAVTLQAFEQWRAGITDESRGEA